MRRLRKALGLGLLLALLILVVQCRPAQPVSVTPDTQANAGQCDDMPDDGQQHPCMFNGYFAAPKPMAVREKQSISADGCGWLLLTSAAEPNTATRLCVPRGTYDRYRVGDTYYLFDIPPDAIRGGA